MNRTDLTRYTQLIARRWRLLVIVIGLALNVSILQSTLSDETFQTTSRIVIVERPAGDLLLNRPARDLDRALQTELRELEGSELRTEANELLRLDDTDVDFESEDPDLLLVTARFGTAQGAAVIANTYASTFVALRQNEEIAKLELAKGQVESQLGTLQLEIDDLEAQLALDPADLRASVRLDARLSQQNELLSQIDDIDFLIASDPAGVELGEAATEPADPISPRPVRSAIFALVLGSVLAVVIALIADSVDDTIRTTEDLDTADTGVPILGAIPPCSLLDNDVASLVEPESATAEAYRILRASVLHSMGRKPNLLIQVTSSGFGEGKSNVAANLAVSFAGIGIKTALVDADLRSDGLGTRFSELGGPGLVELLTGELPLDEPLKRLGRSSTLRGLGRGTVTVNPAEVLSIDRARSVFRHLKESFDVTIIDTPEVLPYADATVMSGMVDGTVVVLRAGETRRRALDEAFANLGLVDARVVGTVLVDAPDGLRRSDSTSRGFVPFDERMLALGVGPAQLPPAHLAEETDELMAGPEDDGPDLSLDERGDGPIALPAVDADDDSDDETSETDVASEPPIAPQRRTRKRIQPTSKTASGAVRTGASPDPARKRASSGQASASAGSVKKGASSGQERKSASAGSVKKGASSGQERKSASAGSVKKAASSGQAKKAASAGSAKKGASARRRSEDDARADDGSTTARSTSAAEPATSRSDASRHRPRMGKDAPTKPKKTPSAETDD
jgi:capsular exopolysaccharide synthesis family protein